MSKKLVSPVPECSGTVTITTAPTMQMVEAFMDAKFLHTIRVVRSFPVVENGKFVYLDDGKTIKYADTYVVVDAENITPEQIAKRRERVFNAALAFTEKWEVKGQPEIMRSRDDLNPRPFDDVTKLILWFLDEIFNFCMSERDIPKALQPESTDILQTPATIESLAS